MLDALLIFLKMPFVWFALGGLLLVWGIPTLFNLFHDGVKAASND